MESNNTDCKIKFYNCFINIYNENNIYRFNKVFYSLFTNFYSYMNILKHIEEDIITQNYELFINFNGDEEKIIKKLKHYISFTNEENIKNLKNLINYFKIYKSKELKFFREEKEEKEEKRERLHNIDSNEKRIYYFNFLEKHLSPIRILLIFLKFMLYDLMKKRDEGLKKLKGPLNEKLNQEYSVKKINFINGKEEEVKEEVKEEGEEGEEEKIRRNFFDNTFNMFKKIIKTQPKRRIETQPERKKIPQRQQPLKALVIPTDEFSQRINEVIDIFKEVVKSVSGYSTFNEIVKLEEMINLIEVELELGTNTVQDLDKKIKDKNFNEFIRIYDLIKDKKTQSEIDEIIFTEFGKRNNLKSSKRREGNENIPGEIKQELISVPTSSVDIRMIQEIITIINNKDSNEKKAILIMKNILKLDEMNINNKPINEKNIDSEDITNVLEPLYEIGISSTNLNNDINKTYFIIVTRLGGPSNILKDEFANNIISFFIGADFNQINELYKIDSYDLIEKKLSPIIYPLYYYLFERRGTEREDGSRFIKIKEEIKTNYEKSYTEIDKKKLANKILNVVKSGNLPRDTQNNNQEYFNNIKKNGSELIKNLNNVYNNILDEINKKRAFYKRFYYFFEENTKTKDIKEQDTLDFNIYQYNNENETRELMPYSKKIKELINEYNLKVKSLQTNKKIGFRFISNELNIYPIGGNKKAFENKYLQLYKDIDYLKREKMCLSIIMHNDKILNDMLFEVYNTEAKTYIKFVRRDGQEFTEDIRTSFDNSKGQKNENPKIYYNGNEFGEYSSLLYAQDNQNVNNKCFFDEEDSECQENIYGENMKGIYSYIDKFKETENKPPIILLGYGFSGSGKTYTLLNTEKDEQGILYKIIEKYKDDIDEIKIFDIYKKIIYEKSSTELTPQISGENGIYNIKIIKNNKDYSDDKERREYKEKIVNLDNNTENDKMRKLYDPYNIYKRRDGGWQKVREEFKEHIIKGTEDKDFLRVEGNINFITTEIVKKRNTSFKSEFFTNSIDLHIYEGYYKSENTYLVYEDDKYINRIEGALEDIKKDRITKKNIKSTINNPESSRSILKIEINIKYLKIIIIDLPGSENAFNIFESGIPKVLYNKQYNVFWKILLKLSLKFNLIQKYFSKFKSDLINWLTKYSETLNKTGDTSYVEEKINNIVTTMFTDLGTNYQDFKKKDIGIFLKNYNLMLGEGLFINDFLVRMLEIIKRKANAEHNENVQELKNIDMKMNWSTLGRFMDDENINNAEDLDKHNVIGLKEGIYNQFAKLKNLDDYYANDNPHKTLLYEIHNSRVFIIGHIRSHYNSPNKTITQETINSVKYGNLNTLYFCDKLNYISGYRNEKTEENQNIEKGLTELNIKWNNNAKPISSSGGAIKKRKLKLRLKYKLNKKQKNQRSKSKNPINHL